MATVQDLIEAAYNRSTANDAGKGAQDPELILHLNRLHDRFVTLLVRARPDEFSVVAALTALAGAPPAVTLPAVLDILLVQNATGGKVHLIPAAQRDMLWHSAPAIYQTTTQLISRGKTGDPVAGDVLTATTLALPTPLIALNTAIDARLPVRHHQLLIDALALYLDTKDEERGEAEHQKILSEFQQSLLAFQAEFKLSPSAVEFAREIVKPREAVNGNR